jgi:hypothetical protein
MWHRRSSLQQLESLNNAKSGRNPLRRFAAEISYSHQVDHPSDDKKIRKRVKDKDDDEKGDKKDDEKGDKKEKERLALPFARKTARVVTELCPVPLAAQELAKPNFANGAALRRGQYY